VFLLAPAPLLFRVLPIHNPAVPMPERGALNLSYFSETTYAGL
jgi:hypothetical protein